MHMHIHIPQEWDTASALEQGSTAGSAQSLGEMTKIVSFHQAERAGSEGRTAPSWEGETKGVCSD